MFRTKRARSFDSFRRSVLLGLIAISGLATAPVLAIADDRGSDEDWQPGLTIFMAGLPEERAGWAETEFQGFQDGESVGLPWSVGVGLEVASPPLFDFPAEPRLVVHAEFAYVLDNNDPVTSVGDPGGRPFVSPFFPQPISIEGQGAAMKAQAKPWVVTGGLGSQVEFELFDRAVYLRPSVEWMYRQDTIQSIVGAGEAEVLDGSGNCSPCRVLLIDAEREKGYHSLGAGIDAAIDAGRAGPMLARFFTTFRVYHILGDRKAEISETGTWELEDGSPSTRVPPTSSITGRHEREPVHYRVGAGFRLLWSPE
ncbi:MAG: hypothetical protein CL931_11565 [Deltaproteobacteria bacterium]|nr:hypothetical protein [Deltaproteobacteria bacterium]